MMATQQSGQQMTPRPDAGGERAAGGWPGVVERAVAASGLELVKAELVGGGGRRLLRVYVDQPGGVSLGDCERASRAVSAALDADETAVPGSYTLEVSSPGLDRPLVKIEDFERFQGQRAEVRSRVPLDGARRHLGILRGADATGIRLQPEAGPERLIAWEAVAQARLAPLWPAPARGRRKK